MPKRKNPEDPIFYTYAYLDPRKSGDFIYRRGIDEVYCYNYEPIYFGKGVDDRIDKHITDALETDKNHIFLNVIRKIYEAGLEPIRFKILQNVTEKEAFTEEINSISIVGRRNLGKGPLCNLTDGGEGCSGLKRSTESKMKQSETSKGKFPEGEQPEGWIKGNLMEGENNAFFNKTHDKETCKKNERIEERYSA